MPELPEVETVRRILSEHVHGTRIIEVLVHESKIVQPATSDEFKKKLTGQRIQHIDRKGKYLIFKLDDTVLLVHLRMEGKFYLKPQATPKTKHEHVTFILDDQRRLSYEDVRKFGTMHLYSKDDYLKVSSLSKLGPEGNAENIDYPQLISKIKRASRAIKTVLLDQTIVSGLGNIYVDETLFCAKIHPLTRACQLNEGDIKVILECAKRVLDEAVKLGGTTIRSYVNTLGISGRFQTKLKVHLRQNESCERCAAPIHKIKVGGRGTYYCPTCQINQPQGVSHD